MKLKKSFLMATSSLLLASSLTGFLAGCGNNTEEDPENLPFDSIEGLENDIELNDDGGILFENVPLKVWTIVGDPDLSVYRTLVDDFNNAFRGKIKISLRAIGHYDFYATLEQTWENDRESMPDVLFMHNEKTIQYANLNMIYPIEKVMEAANFEFNFDPAYDNIDRAQIYKGVRFGVPADAHGWLTHFRQDVIKKNNLGFDGNTRFIPKDRAEYQHLLEALYAKANSTEGLLVRNINKGANHEWKKVNPDNFYPEFLQSCDPDALGALYANGGRLGSEDGKTVKFHENEGVKTYLTDYVERFTSKLMGEAGTCTETFTNGTAIIFPEGPWWTSQNYDPNMNNKELRTANAALGISQEDATDPVYAYPMAASNSAGWWTLDENKNTENGSKWYGNGHAFSLTRTVTSLTTAAAGLTFMKWFTQGQDKEGVYNLAKWGKGGHIPAWKNVYDDESYKEILNDNLTLKALGDPANIMAMEPLAYESTFFDAFFNATNGIQTGLKGGNIKTKEDAIKLLNDTATSCQAALDLLFEE